MTVAEEVGGELVVAGGEASAVFEAAEHALDGVAALVEGLAEAAFPATIPLGWDVRDGTLILDQVSDAVAIIGTVCVDDAATGRASSGCSAARQSAACPGVSRKASGRPCRSVRAWTLVLRPPRMTPIAWRCAPLFRPLPSGAPSHGCCRSTPQ